MRTSSAEGLNSGAPQGIRRLDFLPRTEREENAVVAFLKTVTDGYPGPSREGCRFFFAGSGYHHAIRCVGGARCFDKSRIQGL